MTVTVIGLQIAPGSRIPMRSVEHVQLDTGHGIKGDRYENSRKRHVTVQSREEIAAAEATLDRSLNPVETRRNITLSEGILDRTPGASMTIGSVQLAVVRDAAPCKLLEDSFGAGATAALRKRAGVVCEVVKGGSIEIGDEVIGLATA